MTNMKMVFHLINMTNGIAKILILASAILCGSALAKTEVSGRFIAQYQSSNSHSPWINGGTDILLADKNGLKIAQAVLITNTDIVSGLTFESVLNVFEDGAQKIGITQALLSYKPLSANKIRQKYRIGFFYPEMSFENTSAGWLSPYTYTNSGINSWIGEEMRVLGAEVSLFSQGRQRRSPWSWELNTALYQGNDPFGAILAWRGFALHDRQSLHHDRIDFATYPTVVSTELFNHPTYITPFEEIDNRWGVYVGFHLDYLRSTKVRFYHYDNRADPTAINAVRMYAWHTKFNSFSFIHKIKNVTILGQAMRGSTDMGNRFVSADFNSAYAMISYQQNKHVTSARIETFEVNEDDDIPEDINDSHGEAFTLAWKYQLSRHINVGAEYHINQTDVKNRATVLEAVHQVQRQWLAVVELSF